MKKIIALIMLSLTFLISACGGSSMSLNPDRAESDDASQITMHMIGEDGEGFEDLTRTEIPLAVFGSEDSLESSYFDISINGEDFRTDLNPDDYYVSEVELVGFYIPDLTDADTITFTIHLAAATVDDDGSTTFTFFEVLYEGQVSTSEDSAAILIVAE